MDAAEVKKVFEKLAFPTDNAINSAMMIRDSAHECRAIWAVMLSEMQREMFGQ